MKRSTLILIGVLILLAVGTYFVLQQPGETSTEPGTAMLVDFDSAAVDKLEITSGGETIALAKEGGKWMVVSPVHKRADEAAVTAALSRGKRIGIRSLVSTNPEKQQLFQVDSIGTLVRVFENGTEKAAFRIGKAGTSYDETYARREGSLEVYTVDGPLSYIFVKSPSDWRDRSILSVNREQIQTVHYRFGDTTVALEFHDSLWTVDGAPASETAVQSLLGSLSNFIASGFVDSAMSPPGRPTASMVVLNTEIRFYRQKDAAKYFVQTSREPQWYEIEEWKAAGVLKRSKDLRAS